MTKPLLCPIVLLSLAFPAAAANIDWGPHRLGDHEVVLDSQGRLQSWTTFDHVVHGSMQFIEHCPTVRTKFGDDPWYLVTSVLSDHGGFLRNQNCQGSHAYWSVETATRYYAYTGDEEILKVARRIVDRVLQYHTPADWAWANVPRTQDNSPDGEYTDDYSEPDKMCLVGVAYLKFYKLTGDEKYLRAARGIADTIAAHVGDGSATVSPLPFRVSLKDGKVRDDYTSHMVSAVLLFDELLRLGEEGGGAYRAKRDRLWNWVLKYPVVNGQWASYYEDVASNHKNLNQQSPLETARFMLRRPELDPDYKRDVPALIGWVKQHFGKTKRYGATSIREQNICPPEMSSHTSRYASVVARWFAVSQAPADREEARASFALASYTSFSKYSHDGMAVNYVGLGYIRPWFTDSYFDYVTHILDGMSELPEMAPSDSDHILGSDSIIRKVSYRPKRIEYETFEPAGSEILRITFKPQQVLADGKPLAAESWNYGDFRGVPGVLRIRRTNAHKIVIE